MAIPVQLQKQPTDPKTGRFVKKAVRLCKICGDFARPTKKYKTGFRAKLLCEKHFKEWDSNNHINGQEKRRKTKRVLWAYGLPGGEYTKCPYIHPNWPEHKELRRWKGWRLYWSRRNKTYYKSKAFEWAEKGLIDITPQELYNLITSSSNIPRE